MKKVIWHLCNRSLTGAFFVYKLTSPTDKCVGFLGDFLSICEFTPKSEIYKSR